MDKKQIELTSSMEDYLEAIAALKKRNGIARVRDLGVVMEVKNSSVNSALNCLAKMNLVVHEHYGHIDLTPEGEKIAQTIQEKHDTLKDFLIEVLTLDEKNAEIDACNMEHAISQKTFKRLSAFIAAFNKCPYKTNSAVNCLKLK